MRPQSTKQKHPAKKFNDGFERGGAPLHSWGIVEDSRGRILGKMHCPSSMLANDIETVKKFLIEIQKGKMTMAQEKPQGKTNIVYLEGVIKTLKIRDDESAFVLLDVNPDSKYISLTIHQDRQLHGQLSQFREEDTLQVQGFLRAWSQQKNGVWENKTEVRITRIANKPPVRTKQQQPADDDAVPF